MGTLKTMERQETPGMKRRLVNLADSDNDEEVKPPIPKKKEEEITKIKRFCRVIDFSVYKMLQTVKYNCSVEGFDYLISSSILE